MISTDRITVDADEEFDLSTLARLIWGNRLLIALVALVVGGIAAAMAFTAVPVFRAEATIVPVHEKELATGGLGNQLGALTSLVGVTLGQGGASTQTADAVLESRRLIEEFIVVAFVCVLFLFHLRSAFVAIVSLPLGILAGTVAALLGAAFWALIAMGKSLSLTVVGQGVETREQAEFLRTHACDELQGFYFKRPLPADEFAQLLRDQTTEVTYIGARRGVSGTL